MSSGAGDPNSGPNPNPQAGPWTGPPQTGPWTPPQSGAPPGGPWTGPPQSGPWTGPPLGGVPFPPAGDPGTLDLPYYGIGFFGAVRRAFAKYVRFDGRASRSEYWWYALFNAIVYVVLSVLGIVLGLVTGNNLTSDGGNLGWGFWPFAILVVIFLLGSVIPGISITVRRLHDQDLSGWLVLLNLIPYLGSFVVAIFALLPSKPSGARFDQVRQRPAIQPGPYGPG